MPSAEAEEEGEGAEEEEGEEEDEVAAGPFGGLMRREMVPPTRTPSSSGAGFASSTQLGAAVGSAPAPSLPDGSARSANQSQVFGVPTTGFRREEMSLPSSSIGI